jgi:hypothetical protein
VLYVHVIRNYCVVFTCIFRSTRLSCFQCDHSSLLKSCIFWDIMLCSHLKVNRRFGGTCHLYLQGRRIPLTSVDLQRTHGVAYPRTELFITTAVRTSIPHSSLLSQSSKMWVVCLTITYAERLRIKVRGQYNQSTVAIYTSTVVVPEAIYLSMKRDKL